MEYRRLGNTDILASEIGMGSEGFVGMPEADALALIDAAIAGGVNYFDLYNPQPEVRTHLGKGIAGRRDKVYIQGHLGTAWVDGQYTRTRELALTKASFEEMLSMLDVLVDGEFVEEKRNISLRFRGSENQRLIDVPKSVAAGHVVLWNA